MLIQGKAKGQQLKCKIVSALLTLLCSFPRKFHTSFRVFQNLSPRTFLKIKVLYFSSKRLKDNKRKKNKRFCTLASEHRKGGVVLIRGCFQKVVFVLPPNAGICSLACFKGQLGEDFLTVSSFLSFANKGKNRRLKDENRHLKDENRHLEDGKLALKREMLKKGQNRHQKKNQTALNLGCR